MLFCILQSFPAAPPHNHHSVGRSEQMNGLEDDDGPEKGEAPDITDVVEESGLDEGGRSNEPVERGERRGFVAIRDWGRGVA